MIVGVFSDSHGNARRLKAALGAFASRGVQAVVHCGDIGSVECLRLLGSAGVPAYAVAGNMDRDADALASTARGCGVTFSRTYVEAPLDDGKLLAATHGNDSGLLRELVESGRYAYICCGHTHRRRDERVAGVRVVNPGALRHPIGTWHPTVVILDTKADRVDVMTVP